MIQQMSEGVAYYTGNSTNPSVCTVVRAGIAHAELPAGERRAFETLNRQHAQSAPGTYVAFTLNDTVRYLWTDVAKACWYDTLDALYDRQG